MAITINAYENSGSISTSEWSITTNTAGPNVDTADGVYQAFLDLNAMAVSDVFEFKVYETVKAGGTQRLASVTRFANAQSTPAWVSPSFILGHGWDMTLKKISGTDREIVWSIRKVA
jgi:hypothetical protein